MSTTYLLCIAACQQAASMHLHREQRAHTPEYSFDIIRVFKHIVLRFFVLACRIYLFLHSVVARCNKKAVLSQR